MQLVVGLRRFVHHRLVTVGVEWGTFSRDDLETLLLQDVDQRLVERRDTVDAMDHGVVEGVEHRQEVLDQV